MTRRQPWLDGPVSRLQAHAEANCEDVETLAAIHTEARRRNTPEAGELVTRIQGMLSAIGGRDAEPETAMDTPARLAATICLLRELRARLEAAESGANKAESRAAEMERRAAAAAIAAREAGTALQALHARIYLAPSAPPWLVEAVERAFRHRYHPDRYTDPVRQERTAAILSDAETVFAHLRAATREKVSG